MGGYLAYTEYKDSGVEWLGKIPTTWKIMPIKFALSIPITDGPHETPELQDEGIPFISAEAIKNDRIDFSKKRGFISIEEHKRFSKKYKPQYGDVYMVKSGATTGNVARVETEEEFNIWSPLAVLRPTKDISTTNFLFYAMKSKSFFYAVELSWSFGTQQNIGMGVISNIEIALPPIEEQRSIARFLDYKTAQIDALIAKKETLLKKLAEKRTALISQAVTKGCDRTVPMKGSGIEWLGEIPAHWSTPPLYARYSLELGKMLNESRISGEYLVPYLRNIDVQWDFINQNDLPEMDIRPNEYQRYLVQAGDLLVCEGGEAGRSASVPEIECHLGYQKALHRLRPLTSEESPRFLYYTMVWAASLGVFLAGGNPNTIPHLTGEKLRLYRLPKPPLAEQIEIASFLDKQTVQLHQQVTQVKAVIDKLKEYRTALITNAVTGKIDVRDVVFELEPLEAA